MEKITSLAKRLKSRASQEPRLHSLTLLEGELFSWNHTACAISYDSSATNGPAYLLHEFGHALLDHTTYTQDIELLKMERAAWDKAVSIASGYKVTIPGEIIEGAIDSYRDWIHSRSLCPNCHITGIQIDKNHYSCVSCHTDWHVNEARTCALRRHQIKKRS